MRPTSTNGQFQHDFIVLSSALPYPANLGEKRIELSPGNAEASPFHSYGGFSVLTNKAFSGEIQLTGGDASWGYCLIPLRRHRTAWLRLLDGSSAGEDRSLRMQVSCESFYSLHCQWTN